MFGYFVLITLNILMLQRGNFDFFFFFLASVHKFKSTGYLKCYFCFTKFGILRLPWIKALTPEDKVHAEIIILKI